MSDYEGLSFCCYCRESSNDLEPHPFTDYATTELVCHTCFEALFELSPSDTLEVSDEHFTFWLEKKNMRDIQTVNTMEEVRHFYDDLRYSRKDVAKWTFSVDGSGGRYHHDQLDEAEEDTLQVYWEETGNRFDPSETKVKPTDRWRLAESERLDREEEEINKKRAKLANYKRRKVK